MIIIMKVGMINLLKWIGFMVLRVRAPQQVGMLVSRLTDSDKLTNLSPTMIIIKGGIINE